MFCEHIWAIQKTISINDNRTAVIHKGRASLVAWRLKRLPAFAGNLGLIPGSGRSPGEGNGNPLQDSCLGSPTNRGAWGAMVYRVTKELDMTERLTLSFLQR